MLDEYKQMYKSQASAVLQPGWEKVDKNKLCNLYIENESNPQLRDAYFCAIVYRYWGLIQKIYMKSYNVISPEDAYEWLFDSITYALEHRSWLRPTSSIYNDPCGPDKAINRKMKCCRLTYYQTINRKKRRDGNLMLSLDKIKDDLNDSTDSFTDFADLDNIGNLNIKLRVQNCFVKKQYIYAFITDFICYGRVFERKKMSNGMSKAVLSLKKLILKLEKVDTKYLSNFASRYGINDQEVQNAWYRTCNGKTKDDFRKDVRQYFEILVGGDYFKEAKVLGVTTADFIEMFTDEKKKNDGYYENLFE